jgi:hypothetical protein
MAEPGWARAVTLAMRGRSPRWNGEREGGMASGNGEWRLGEMIGAGGLTGCCVWLFFLPRQNGRQPNLGWSLIRGLSCIMAAADAAFSLLLVPLNQRWVRLVI